MLDWQVRLTEAMAERSMTQAALAAEVGVPPPTILTWMGTAPSAKPIRDISATRMLRACAALHVRPEWLMLGELPKRPVTDWPFAVHRDRVETLPVLVRLLIDRIISDVVSVLAPEHGPS